MNSREYSGLGINSRGSSAQRRITRWRKSVSADARSPSTNHCWPPACKKARIVISRPNSWNEVASLLLEEQQIDGLVTWCSTHNCWLCRIHLQNSATVSSRSVLEVVGQLHRIVPELHGRLKMDWQNVTIFQTISGLGQFNVRIIIRSPDPIRMSAIRVKNTPRDHLPICDQSASPLLCTRWVFQAQSCCQINNEWRINYRFQAIATPHHESWNYRYDARSNKGH